MEISNLESRKRLFSYSWSMRGWQMLDFLTMALKWVVKSPFSSVDISHQGKLSEMGGEEEEEMEARLFLTLDHAGDLLDTPKTIESGNR